MKKSKKITIRDIARLAGVSPATVSNVLNNPEKVGLESRFKVEKVLNQYGFQPNVHARALKSQTTRTFGLILPTLEEPYYAQIVQGFDDFLKNQNYGFSMFLTQDLFGNEERALQEVVQNKMAGVAIIPSMAQADNFLPRFEEMSFPCVYIDRVPLNFSNPMGNVLVADYQSLAIFVASMLRQEKNVRNVLFLTGNQLFFCERVFSENFLASIDEFSFQVIQVDAPLEWTTAFQKFFLILRDNPDITHVVATNHIHARAVLDVADYLGLSIKAYYLGRENWKAVKQNRNVVEVSRPGLKIGRRAAEILIQIAEGKMGHSVQEVIPVYLGSFPETGFSSVKRRAKKKLTEPIKVAMLADPCYDAIRALVQDFFVRYEIPVVLQSLTYEELYQEVVHNPKSIFDVFMVDVSWLPECVHLERLYDLTPMISLTSEPFYGFIPGVLESYALVNGKYFAVPFYFGVQLLFYRRDLFEDNQIRAAFYAEYGRELALPKDWDTYNQIARFFTRSFNPTSPVEYGTTVGAHNDTAIVCEFLPRLWGFGGEIFDRTGRSSISSLQGIKALQNYIDTFNYAPLPNEWWGKQVEHFANGRAAMMIMFTSNVAPLLNRRSSKVYDCTGIAEIPGGTSVLGGWSLGINIRSKNSDAAFEFIRWACSSELAIPFSLLGGCTAHFSVYQSAELVRALPWAKLAERAFVKTRKRAAIPHLGVEVVEQKELEHIIGNCIKAVLNGEMLPEQALKEAQERINSIAFHYVRR